jgi:hypothetical protein
MGSLFGRSRPGYATPAPVWLPGPVPVVVPPPSVPPQSCTPTPEKRASTLVDGFYSDLPPDEVAFLQREARVAFNANARMDETSGDILEFDVPSARTLVVTGLEFYADPQDGGQPLVADALRGYIAAALLFDGRVPFDLLSTMDVPAGSPDPSGIVSGSSFTTLGRVIGPDVTGPHFVLRAREGTSVRAAYSVIRSFPLPIGHIGAILRGFVVPSALLEKKAP